MAKSKQHRTAARLTNRVQQAHTTPAAPPAERRPVAKRRPQNGFVAFVRTFPVLTSSIAVALVALVGFTAVSNHWFVTTPPDPCAWAKNPAGVVIKGAIVRSYSKPPITCITAISPGEYTVTLHTTRGDIVLELDQQQAPATVNNFVFLATHGFYNGVTFHRVVPNFVIQAGDPNTANPKADPKTIGQGGPGYTYNDLLPKDATVFTQGALAMANTNNDPTTTGSQFFICIANDTKSLTPKYFFFGHVTPATLPITLKIQQGDPITSVSVTYDKSAVPGTLPGTLPTATPGA